MSGTFLVPPGFERKLEMILRAIKADFDRKEVVILGLTFRNGSYILRWRAAPSVMWVQEHIQTTATYTEGSFVSSVEVNCTADRIHDTIIPNGTYYVWLIPVEKGAGAIKKLDGEQGRPDAMSFWMTKTA